MIRKEGLLKISDLVKLVGICTFREPLKQTFKEEDKAARKRMEKAVDSRNRMELFVDGLNSRRLNGQ